MHIYVYINIAHLQHRFPSRVNDRTSFRNETKALFFSALGWPEAHKINNPPGVVDAQRREKHPGDEDERAMEQEEILVIFANLRMIHASREKTPKHTITGDHS